MSLSVCVFVRVSLCVCVSGQERADCKKKSCNLTQHKDQLPAAKDDLSIYWRLARPELVRKWQSAPGGKQVSSDAFSRFAGEVLARLVPKVSAWSE